MFMKNVLQNHTPFWFIDTSLASDNPSRFRKNLLRSTKKLIMTTNGTIRDEKLLFYIN